jgi:hypothetical protein
VDPTYYAAFAWALLDSIADTSTHPPKFRPHREMSCITKMDNESGMIKSYIKTKKIRAALSIESDTMQRIPEVGRFFFYFLLCWCYYCLYVDVLFIAVFAVPDSPLCVLKLVFTLILMHTM